MGFYEKYLLPKLLNLAMKNREMSRLRGEWVPRVSGRVLEIGIGSGLNLPFYQNDVAVTGVDPSAELRVMAEEVAADNQVDVEFVTRTAEDLPFDDNTFDAAVVTWTFCTIPQPELAVQEIRRVMKKSGQLIFIEHGRSTEANVVKWQDRLNPMWKRIGGGCNLNRQPDLMLQEHGFAFKQLEQSYIPGPKWATYTYRGVAIPA